MKRSLGKIDKKNKSNFQNQYSEHIYEVGLNTTRFIHKTCFKASDTCLMDSPIGQEGSRLGLKKKLLEHHVHFVYSDNYFYPRIRL